MSTLNDKQIREKLISRGAEQLSDSELLSIIISDTTNTSAIDLAEKILASNSLCELAGMELRKLRMVEGLGIKRAVALYSAFELRHRIGDQDEVKTEVINSNADVIRIFQKKLFALKHEEFWAVYLNSGNRIIDKVRISQGGVSGMVVDHKLIVKRAVELLSPSILFVHNHPSGVAKPSDEDITITERLVLAASLFDIEILDHVIITHGSSFSFRANKLIG